MLPLDNIRKRRLLKPEVRQRIKRVLPLTFLSSAFMKLRLAPDSIQDVARYNPVTKVLEAARQGFVGDVSWADTWPGLVALAGLAIVVVFLALRGLQRAGD